MKNELKAVQTVTNLKEDDTSYAVYARDKIRIRHPRRLCNCSHRSGQPNPSYYKEATSSGEYLFISERSRYGDHLAQGHPKKTVRRSEYEPHDAYFVNFGKGLKRLRIFGDVLEHTGALMGITVHPVARQESESESMKNVVRSSRSCLYLTITAIMIPFNAMFSVITALITTGLISSK